MSTEQVHPMPAHYERILSIAAMFGMAALVLFYSFPYTFPQLGFNPHVLAMAAGGALLLTQRYGRWREYTFPLSFLGVALLSIVSAPAVPVMDMARAWLVSLGAFWLFRNVFGLLPQHGLDAGIQVLLALWSVAAIAQVLYGGGAYVSSWLGISPNCIYATGLSNFSNHGAILLLPMLVWTLVFNLDQPGWRRSLLWLAGCAALYFTLSRAGWLALGIAMLILALRLRRQPGKMRGLALHAALALLAVLLAWAAPTRIDPYEPGGERSAGRWEVLDSGGDYSGATRRVTLQVAARAVTEHPLTGIGLGRFPEYYAKHHAEYLGSAAVDPRVRMTPHNGYAQFVAELGIPAFLVLLLWLGWILQRAAKSAEPAALAFHASIFGMAGWLVFHDGLYDRQLWILTGCLAALVVKQASARNGL